MDESANENKPAKTELAKTDAAKIDAAETEELNADGEKPKVKLTAEEQMAAFEKAMKEDDWGHQPC